MLTSTFNKLYIMEHMLTLISVVVRDHCLAPTYTIKKIRSDVLRDIVVLVYQCRFRINH